MTNGLFQRIDSDHRDTVHFTFDGAHVDGLAEDTILAALLRQGTRIGNSEFDNAPRAGFCLMGSCQECILWDEGGRRLRACMVDIRDGMTLRSTPYAERAGNG